MDELFTEKHWFGEFFPPGSYENRFAGEIHYSLEHGVTLTYSILNLDRFEETEVLHGNLSTGEKCTLVGQFSLDGTKTYSDGRTTRHGTAGFELLAVGDFLSRNEQFAELDFSLTNLQEFFYPRGFKDKVKYSKKAIYSVTTPFGEMEVYNTAKFKPLHNDIKAQIYSHDSEALDELSQTFEGIKAKHPQANFMLKNDIAYRINLKFLNARTIYEAYECVAGISNLFALLIYNPVYPESIHVHKPGVDGYSLEIQIYPSILLDSRTIGLCTKDRIHQIMPIKQSTVPIDSVLGNWLEMQDEYSPIISSIQHETGFRDEHTAHGEIVLYATQLESISHGAGKSNSEKYEYPLTEYGCAKISDALMRTLGTSTIGKTGTAIGDLRNEIAHFKRPKKWLKILSVQDLVDISRYIQLTMIGYILTKIGVPKDVVASYQEKYSPRL